MVFNLPRDMDETRLSNELAPFGQILDVGILRGETENQAIIQMSKNSDAINANDFLQKVYNLRTSLEQADAQSSAGMREIWIGNLPQTCTQEKIAKHFFIYGEIEFIDMFMFKNFAFVRFFELAAAARALDLGKNIKIDGRPIKLSYADPVRRKESLGNNPNYAFSEKIAKVVLLKFITVSMAPPEESLKSAMIKYGNIKNMLVLESPQDPVIKPHVYIEFETHVYFLLK